MLKAMHQSGQMVYIFNCCHHKCMNCPKLFCYEQSCLGIAHTGTFTLCCSKQGHAVPCQMVLQMAPKPQPKLVSLYDGHAMLGPATTVVVGSATESNSPPLLMLQILGGFC